MKYIVAFAAFWWDFIVGDSITLAVGAIVGLASAYALAHNGLSGAGEVLLPGVVVVTLVASLGRP